MTLNLDSMNSEEFQEYLNFAIKHFADEQKSLVTGRRLYK